MKFAYIIRGDYDYQIDRAVIHEGTARIIGARKVIDATENKIPIGYVAYLPEQDEILKAAFPKLK